MFPLLQNVFNIHMVINKFYVAWVCPRHNRSLARDPAAFSEVIFLSGVSLVPFFTCCLLTQFLAGSGGAGWYLKGMHVLFFSVGPQALQNDIAVDVPGQHSW